MKGTEIAFTQRGTRKASAPLGARKASAPLVKGARPVTRFPSDS